MCIYMGAKKFGPFQCQKSAPLPPRFSTIYDAGSGEKKIDLYYFHVHNPEDCCFIVFADLVRYA